jgi:hypothetical protein
MVFQNENAETTEMDALGKKYLAELKEKANIVRR